MLWMLITPNAVVTPQLERNVAMRSPTVLRASDMLGLSAGDVERGTSDERSDRRGQENQGLRRFLGPADPAQWNAAAACELARPVVVFQAGIVGERRLEAALPLARVNQTQE